MQNPHSIYEKKQHEFELLLNKLTILNPLAILEKGYSVVEHNQKIVNDVKSIKINDEIDIRLSKGILKATVNEIKN